MASSHILHILHFGDSDIPESVGYLDLLPIAKHKSFFGTKRELLLEHPEFEPYTKRSPILALIDKETSGKDLCGRVYGYTVKDSGVQEHQVDYSLASMIKWVLSDEPLTKLHLEKKREPPVLAIVTSQSTKSRLFKERLLPKLRPLLPKDLVVEEIEFNDDGIATRPVPKDIYNWVAWFPFIALFTSKSYNANKDLTGVVFRGVLDDYWENEYKVSPDLDMPERYDVHDIVHWIDATTDLAIFKETPKIPRVGF